MPKPTPCRGCALDITGGPFLPPEGLGSMGVMVISDYPNAVKRLTPMTETQFNRAHSREGISKDGFVLASCIQCRPPYDKLEGSSYETSAINHCQRHIQDLVHRTRPRVLLCLGNLPLRTYAGYSGRKQQVSNVRGYFLDGIIFDLPVIATYDPAFVYTSGKPSLSKVIGMDTKRAVELASSIAKGNSIVRPAQDGYVSFPPISHAENYKDKVLSDTSLSISIDIETEESLKEDDESSISTTQDGRLVVSGQDDSAEDSPADELTEGRKAISSTIVSHTKITQIQFATNDQEAIVLPWVEPYISNVIKPLLAGPHRKYTWNGRGFDYPILRAHGCTMNGRHYDGMLMWHHYQPDYPMGLQFVGSFFWPQMLPWKHIHQGDPGLYGCKDVVVPYRICDQLPPLMQRLGIWGSAESMLGFEGQVQEFTTVLDEMQDRGMPIDNDRRIALRADIVKEMALLWDKIQPIAPVELCDYHPKQGFTNPKRPTRIPKTLLDDGYCLDDLVQKDFVIELKEREYKRQLKKAGFTDDSNSEAALSFLPRIQTQTRWVLVKGFNPNSSQQVLKYIKMKIEEEKRDLAEAHRAYKSNHKWWMPEDPKEPGKEYTGAQELLRLGRKTGDILLPLIVEYKQLGKIVGTFIDGFAPSPISGCVHTTFRLSPATGQLASSSPNCQNTPSHGVLAKKWMEIEAAE